MLFTHIIQNFENFEHEKNSAFITRLGDDKYKSNICVPWTFTVNSF